jgi:hypothetical protein
MEAAVGDFTKSARTVHRNRFAIDRSRDESRL